MIKKALYTTSLLLIIGLAGMLVLKTDAHAQASWYDSSWDYRQKITIDSGQIDADLSDFPVYVDLANLSSSFFSNTNNGCGDIRVTQSDGTTEVAREVVACDTASSTGELHFKAPTVSSSSDSEFYIYYGNSSASDYADSDTYGAENVWTNGFAGVYHLQEDPSGSAPQMLNSAGDHSDGTTSGGMTSDDSVSGFIGNALDFDGSNDYVDVPDGSPAKDVFDGATDLTVSVWGRIDDLDKDNSLVMTDPKGGGAQFILWRDETGSNSGNQNTATVLVGDSVLGGNGMSNRVEGADVAWDDTNWRKVDVTYDDNGKLRLYIDGNEDPNSPSDNVGTLGSNSNPLRFGAATDNNQFAAGSTDEIRVADDVRSAEWIASSETNQSSPTSFYTAGSQEVEGSSRMASSNYTIERDSLNSGGRDQVSSANYQVADTVGEQATGQASSSNYRVQAGYRQMGQSSIAISSQQDVNLGSFGGVSGGSADATPSMRVTTDNDAGYELSVKADSDPAMQNTTAGGSFADYNAGTDPDYNFSVSASGSAFGFSPEGANVTQQFLDNGSSCDTGSQNNTGTCWRGFSQSDKIVAQGSDNNQPDGATTTLRLRAESGPDNIQTAGTYEANITVTAVAI